MQSSLIFRDMARAVAAGQSGLHPFPSPSKEKAGMGMVLLQASLVARPSTPTRTLPLMGRASLGPFASTTTSVPPAGLTAALTRPPSAASPQNHPPPPPPVET